MLKKGRECFRVSPGTDVQTQCWHSPAQTRPEAWSRPPDNRVRRIVLLLCLCQTFAKGASLSRRSMSNAVRAGYSTCAANARTRLLDVSIKFTSHCTSTCDACLSNVHDSRITRRRYRCLHTGRLSRLSKSPGKDHSATCTAASVPIVRSGKP